MLTLKPLCDLDPPFKERVAMQWLHVLKGFTVLARSSLTENPQSSNDTTCLGLWSDLGNLLGFDEKEVKREEELTVQRLKGESLKGCSWVMCPLHDGDAATDTMMVCCGCRVVSRLRLQSSSTN